MSRIVAEELDPLFVWNAKNVARVLWGRLRSRLS